MKGSFSGVQLNKKGVGGHLKAYYNLPSFVTTKASVNINVRYSQMYSS
jgi:hypothetical protein